MDQFTEQTTEGLGGRLLGSIKGMLAGLIFFAAAFPVLWWNEGYAVKTARSLSQGAKDVISVAADKVDRANDGKLVHVAGRASTAESVADPLFNVSANAIKLRRKVEMYQWRETSSSRKEKNFGGSQTTRTTYSYAPGWSEQPVNSAEFKQPQGHGNPPMPLRSAEYTAGRVTLGGFRLNGSQIGELTGAEPVDVSAAKLPESIRERAHPAESGFQVGNPASPQVGDLRITFSQVKPTDVSVVARQVSDTFEPFLERAGGSIDLVAMGIQGADAMFKTAQSQNTTRTWILRGVGWLAMLLGLALIFRPLAMLGDIVPFVGGVLRAGVGLVSFAVSLCLSLVTIAAAWIAYRPLVGIGLMAGGVLVLWGVTRMRKPAAVDRAHAVAAGR